MDTTEEVLFNWNDPVVKKIEEAVFTGLLDFGVDQSTASRDSRFEEIGLDSLDKLELGFHMEENFEIVHYDSSYDGALAASETVGDLIKLIYDNTMKGN